MIFGNIEKVDIKQFDDSIQYCINYFKQHDLINYTPGTYVTDENNIIFRIDEYETQIAQERFWQAHKTHKDVYILLRGTERIDVNIAEQKSYHYDKLSDILMLEEAKPTNINLLLNHGDFLICNPNEAHKTGIHVELKNVFKVVLFKIGQK